MGEEKYIANRIRELRKNAGLDVETVGKGVGRSGKTVSAWETGRNMPSPEMLISICRFFGVSISYFYPPDVTDAKQPAPFSADELMLVDFYRRMQPEYKNLLMDNARAFAALSEKDGQDDGEALGVGAVDAVRHV